MEILIDHIIICEEMNPRSNYNVEKVGEEINKNKSRKPNSLIYVPSNYMHVLEWLLSYKVMNQFLQSLSNDAQMFKHMSVMGVETMNPWIGSILMFIINKNRTHTVQFSDIAHLIHCCHYDKLHTFSYLLSAIWFITCRLHFATLLILVCMNIIQNTFRFTKKIVDYVTEF
jgi:hypothetical protein